MPITFDGSFSFDVVSIVFHAYQGDDFYRCVVERRALVDVALPKKFNQAAIEQTFLELHPKIEDVVRNKIAARDFDADGSVRVRAVDLLAAA